MIRPTFKQSKRHTEAITDIKSAGQNKTNPTPHLMAHCCSVVLPVASCLCPGLHLAACLPVVVDGEAEEVGAWGECQSVAAAVLAGCSMLQL